MDMEAGLEHLGRGTASMMDRFIVVIEPGARSIQTYTRIKELARSSWASRSSPTTPTICGLFRSP